MRALTFPAAFLAVSFLACGGSDRPAETPAPAAGGVFYGIIDSESSDPSHPTPSRQRCMITSRAKRCDFNVDSPNVVSVGNIHGTQTSCFSSGRGPWSVVPAANRAAANARMVADPQFAQIAAQLLAGGMSTRATGERDVVAGVPCTVQELVWSQVGFTIRACVSDLIEPAPQQSFFGGKIEMWTLGVREGKETMRTRVTRVAPLPPGDPLASVCVEGASPAPL